MQVGQHIGILRTHSRNIIQQIRSRTITGNNLTIHPFQTAPGQIYSQPIAAISQLQQLRIGTFLRIKLEPGQYVQTGQTISYLVRNKDKWITANYKETQIANIYIGQQVRIKVDAVPGKIFHGEVTAISEATGSKYSLVPTDNSAGNFVKVQQRIPVRIDLEDVSPEEMAQLRAGMMVETEALRK